MIRAWESRRPEASIMSFRYSMLPVGSQEERARLNSSSSMFKIMRFAH